MSPDTQFLYQHGTVSTWTFTKPINRQPPPLVSALRVACLLLPPCPMSIFTPLTPLAYAQVHIRPWGVVCCWSLCLPCVPASAPPCDYPPPVILWCLVSDRVAIFAHEGEGPRRTHYLAVSCRRSLPPPRYLATLLPFKLPVSLHIEPHTNDNISISF